MFESEDIKFYFSVSFVPVGIFSNMLAFYIFQRKNLNHKSVFGELYSWLCCFNILTLLYKFITALLGYYEIDIVSISSFTCKTFFGFQNFINHLPSFQMILIAYYLYVSICSHKKRDLVHKYKNFFIFGNIIFVFLINCLYIVYERRPIYMEFSNISSNFSSQIYECNIQYVADFIFDMVNLSMRNFIPFIAIFILNYLSMRGYYKSKNQVNHQHHHKPHQYKRNIFLYSIFGANLMFLAIYLPWSIIFCIYQVYHSFMKEELGENRESFEIIISVFESIAYLNNMSTFFINLAVNSLFRRELFLLFHLTKNKLRLSDSSSSTSNTTNSNI